MMKYETLESEFGTYIKRVNDDESVSFIPTDPANSDYQAYLAYVANSAPQG